MPISESKSMRTKFAPDTYNDKPYAIAFLAHVCVVATLVITWTAQGDLYAWKNEHVAHVVNRGQQFMALAFASMATASVVAGVWLVMMTVMPTAIVKVALVSVPVLSAALTIIVFMQGKVLAGFICAIGTLVAVFMVYGWWDRAEFTGRLFKSVSETYGRSRSVFGVAVLLVAAQIGYLALALLCLAGALGPGKSAGGFAGVGLLVVFGVIWTQNVLSYVLYVTCGGVVARWYFGLQTDSAVSKSCKAACTNSFGSICFGSLVITIIQFLRFLVSQARAEAEEERNMVGIILGCIADCILSCLEDILEFVNASAFSYISIYGMPFCDAARQAWGLLSDSDAESLVNYSLVGIVTGFSCLVGGLSTALVSAIMAWRLALAGPAITAAFFIGLVVGVAVMSILSIMMEGGCNTLFVCFAETPALLAGLDPGLKEAFDESRGLRP